MLISYNWIKSYVPDLPTAEKLMDVFTFHICEVESVKKLPNDDFVFDLKILPDRAHDLLSHKGIACDVAGILGLSFNETKYEVPMSKPTKLKIKVETDKCRRYIGRIVRDVKIEPSPKWIKDYLETLGQRSINNIVDATNIVMFDRGNPVHIFDLDKVSGDVVVRQAKKGEKMITLDNKEINLGSSQMVIADEKNILAIAGVKGGKVAEVDNNTKNIIIEVANFDPISVRKTSRAVNIFTDAVKRFENDLSQEVAPLAMKDITLLVLEMCKNSEIEELIDVYPIKQDKKTLDFNLEKISKILGFSVSVDSVKNIFKNYNLEYKNKDNNFTVQIPDIRLDLNNLEDMAEEIGRILGYDKINAKLPKLNSKPKTNESFEKMFLARNKLLDDGYSEVMTYAFRDKGEVEVLASASDKKFLRTNLSDGLKESLRLNQLNAPLLQMEEIKIFEIGTIFKKSGEEIHVAYGDKKNVIEVSLNDFCKVIPKEKYGDLLGTKNDNIKNIFKPWSIYPFISRDIAVWIPKEVESYQVYKVIKENAGDLLIREPFLFDSFTKDGKTSYAFRLVFQSFERTLKDEEINEIMTKIGHKISENSSWQIR